MLRSGSVSRLIVLAGFLVISLTIQAWNGLTILSSRLSSTKMLKRRASPLLKVITDPSHFGSLTS